MLIYLTANDVEAVNLLHREVSATSVGPHSSPHHITGSARHATNMHLFAINNIIKTVSRQLLYYKVYFINKVC